MYTLGDENFESGSAARAGVDRQLAADGFHTFLDDRRAAPRVLEIAV
jgi:hypothetical protein